MGGRVKQGTTIIGGVVTDKVKSFFDKLVRDGKFESRSQAISFVLTKFAENEVEDA